MRVPVELTILMLLATACTPAAKDMEPAALQAESPNSPSQADYARAMAADATDEDRERLIALLPQVTINDNGTPRTRYVWQGDMLLTLQELNSQLRGRVEDSPGTATPELRVMTDSLGRPTFWPRNNRSLTYWVDRGSFPTPEQAARAVTAMQEATRNWVAACASCGLKVDPAANASSATFRVQYQAEDVPYIAAAFFPHDPAFRRVVYIARDFFAPDLGFTQAGVLRHELGHVLGYRHEHIVGIPGCRLEGRQWKELTPYDPKSVMHYFCGGGGTSEMKLSASDVAGHARLYSLP